MRFTLCCVDWGPVDTRDENSADKYLNSAAIYVREKMPCNNSRVCSGNLVSLFFFKNLLHGLIPARRIKYRNKWHSECIERYLSAKAVASKHKYKNPAAALSRMQPDKYA